MRVSTDKLTILIRLEYGKIIAKITPDGGKPQIEVVLIKTTV